MENNMPPNEKGIPGLYIPGQIAFNPYINATEKMLFGIISNLSQTERGCWATNNQLACYLGCTKQHMSTMIAKLQNYKYITVEYINVKNGSTERRMYENDSYAIIYRPLSIAFNEYISSPGGVNMQDILKAVIQNICCPDNPEKFNKDRGFDSTDEFDGGIKKYLNPHKDISKGVLRNILTPVKKNVNHNIIEKGNSKVNRESLLEYKYSKKKACLQAPLRNAKTLNRKKHNTPVQQIKVNSPAQKQQQRLRLDIEAVQQACPEAQKLYEYWNTLGLTRHRDAPTKTKLNSFLQIQKFLTKHTPKQIRIAFDTYAKLCEEHPVKFSKNPYKVSLPDFFGWNPQQKQLVSLISTLKNISGLVDICVLGLDYALGYFQGKSKRVSYDNNIFSKMSNEASKLFGSVKVRRSSDALQRATARLEDFYKDRKRRFDSVSVNGLVPLLFTYVESSNDINSFKLWWLNSENTFNGFEEWLEENGYLKQLNCFDRPDTVYGKDGRIVRCAL